MPYDSVSWQDGRSDPGLFNKGVQISDRIQFDQTVILTLHVRFQTNWFEQVL